MPSDLKTIFGTLRTRVAVMAVLAVLLYSITSSIVLKVSHDMIDAHWVESLPQKARERWVAMETKVDKNQGLISAEDIAVMDDIYEIYENRGLGDEAYIAAYVLSNFTGLLIILMFAAWVVRRFLLPVQAVARAAQKVTDGDLSARAKPSLFSSNELTGLVEDFNHMAIALNQNEQDRKQLIAASAHELRTPLTILHARLTGMKDGIIPTSDEEFARLLTKTDLLARIIEDLRVISLAEAGRLNDNPEQIDLTAIVRNSIAARQIMAATAHVDIHTNLHMARCWADGIRARQIVGNLIDNALHHAAQGKVIEVDTLEEEHFTLLRVADRGPGIPQSDASHIFEPFQRAAEAHALSPGGSGLGLAIVKTLVESQKGRVHAYNRNGGGAVFEIRLPKHTPLTKI